MHDSVAESDDTIQLPKPRDLNSPACAPVFTPTPRNKMAAPYMYVYIEGYFEPMSFSAPINIYFVPLPPSTLLEVLT